MIARTVTDELLGSSRPFSNIADKWTSRFRLSAGVILLITSVAKIASAFGHARILGINDPILGISFRSLMLLSGGIELVISLMCLIAPNCRINLAAVAWIAAVFLSYHFGLWYIHWARPCPCLGNLTDLLRISPGLASLILTWIAIYLFVGALVCWFVMRKQVSPSNPIN